MPDASSKAIKEFDNEFGEGSFEKTTNQLIERARNDRQREATFKSQILAKVLKQGKAEITVFSDTSAEDTIILALEKAETLKIIDVEDIKDGRRTYTITVHPSLQALEVLELIDNISTVFIRAV